MRINDIFCSSPASTAVRPHHDGDVTGGRRSVDSHRRIPNPKNNNKDKTVPCFSSEMPFIPIPRPIMSCRNSFDSSSEFRRKITSAHGGDVQIRRKSSADVNDLLKRTKSSLQDSSSSRYLLKDHMSFKEHDGKELWLSSSSDRSKDLIPFRERNVTSSSSSFSSSSPSSVTDVSSPAPSSDDQVVVLRVSIHCKGCEGKVRKHISKMEGVTSYTIDIATKKVTIVGKVTSLGVVESISRVKFAQLWPSSSSPSFPHLPTHSLLKS